MRSSKFRDVHLRTSDARHGGRVMPHMHISDPAWQTTFPFLVAPYEDEWLTGLLLRCDETNHWGSGTTLAHICRMDEKPTKQHLSLIGASGMKLDYLAQ